MIPSGGDPAMTGVTEAEVMRGLLMQMGIHADKIVMETRSETTIQNAVRETTTIRGHSVEERDKLYAGANTVGGIVRNIQDSHKHGVSELLNNMNRGFAPTITNLFQSDNRHVTLAGQRQAHMLDQRQIHEQGQVQMHDQKQIH